MCSCVDAFDAKNPDDGHPAQDMKGFAGTRAPPVGFKDAPYSLLDGRGQLFNEESSSTSANCALAFFRISLEVRSRLSSLFSAWTLVLLGTRHSGN